MKLLLIVLFIIVLLLSCSTVIKKYDYRGYEVRVEKFGGYYSFTVYYEKQLIIYDYESYEANQFFDRYDKLLSTEFNRIDKLVEIGVK
jgi:hypothetical protein